MHTFSRSCASLALALSLIAGCNTKRNENANVVTANLFNSHYSRSGLSSWNVRAVAAGPRCDVLLVQVDIVLEDAMVLAMHYGDGAYDIYAGGVKQFAGERNIHAVAYLDKTGKLWKFGNVPKRLERCAS